MICRTPSFYSCLFLYTVCQMESDCILDFCYFIVLYISFHLRKCFNLKIKWGRTLLLGTSQEDLNIKKASTVNRKIFSCKSSTTTLCLPIKEMLICKMSHSNHQSIQPIEKAFKKWPFFFLSKSHQNCLLSQKLAIQNFFKGFFFFKGKQISKGISLIQNSIMTVSNLQWLTYDFSTFWGYESDTHCIETGQAKL